VARRPRSPAIGTPTVLDRAEDGTPLFAPRGELPVEDGGGRVQRHLCGRWFRQLGSSHVLYGHGLTAADYRVLAGLRPRHPLQSPDLSALRAARLRGLIATDARLIKGMAAGTALARTGELQRKAEQARRARDVSVERERQLAASGARLGSARAAAYRERRDRRARALGFAGLEDFYRSRYLRDRVRLERLAGELRARRSEAARARTGSQTLARCALAARVVAGRRGSLRLSPRGPGSSRLLPGRVRPQALREALVQRGVQELAGKTGGYQGRLAQQLVDLLGAPVR
jgi:hypothetical protein